MAYELIIAIAQVNNDPKYASYWQRRCFRNMLKISWRLPVLLYKMAKALENFDSFRSTFRITKLLCSL